MLDAGVEGQTRLKEWSPMRQRGDEERTEGLVCFRFGSCREERRGSSLGSFASVEGVLAGNEREDAGA